MPTPEQIEAHKAEWYQAIGELAIAFEHAVMAARQVILVMLPGNSFEGQEMHTTLLSQVGAIQTVKALEAMLERAGKTSEKTREVIGRFAPVSEARNRIVHSAWFIGWASADPNAPWDPNKVVAVVPNRGTKGTAWKVPDLELSDVRGRIREAWALSNDFRGLVVEILG